MKFKIQMTITVEVEAENQIEAERIVYGVSDNVETTVYDHSYDEVENVSVAYPKTIEVMED